MTATLVESERCGKDGLKNLRATLSMKDSDDEEEQHSQQKALDSALFVAVQEGDVRKVMTCLEKGANPNGNNGDCEPPLVEALIAGDIDIAAALLLHSADPLQFSLSGSALTELVSEPAPKILLGYFMGADVDEESKRCLLSSLDKFMRWRVARKIIEFQEQMQGRRPDKQKRHAPASSSCDRRQGTNDDKLKELEQLAVRKARSLADERAQASKSSTSIPEVGTTPQSETNLTLQPTTRVPVKTPVSRVDERTCKSCLKRSHARDGGVGEDDGEWYCAPCWAVFLQEEVLPCSSEAPVQETSPAPPQATSEAKESGFAHQYAELDSEQPLLAAARCGDLEMVKRLLSAKADPNTQDEIGETPLFEAAARGDMNMIATLLLRKGDPSWRSQAGMQPRDLASGSSSVVSLLLDSPTWFGGACSDQDAEKVAGAISDEDIRETLWHKMCHMRAHATLLRQINALPIPGSASLGSA